MWEKRDEGEQQQLRLRVMHGMWAMVRTVTFVIRELGSLKIVLASGEEW